MKRNEVAALYQMRLADLARKKEHIERQKQQFVTEVYKIRTHKIDSKERSTMLARYLKGRPYQDWVDYYSDHIASYDEEMREYKEQLHIYSKAHPNTWVLPAAMIFVALLVGAGVFFTGPTLTTYTVANFEHKTSESPQNSFAQNATNSSANTQEQIAKPAVVYEER